jgi:hypothetical protein
MRSRLLAIPSKLTPRLVLLTDPGKVFRLLTDAIFEALREVSQYRFTEEESPSKEAAK